MASQEGRDWRRYVRANLPALPLPPEREAALIEQVAGQLEDCYDDAIANGRTPDEARAAAESLIPSWTGLATKVVREDRRAGVYRALHRMEMSGGFGRDAVYLLRSICRAPLLYGAVVVILASTIGLSAIVFSAAYGILLSPFPFANFDRLSRVYEVRPDGDRFGVSAPNIRAWGERSDVFEELGVFYPAQLTLGDEDRPERLQAAMVSANFFDVLGLEPALGRSFVEGEDQLSAADVAVLSYSVWTFRFGADERVIGRTIFLDGRPFSVVGILPRSFEFPADRARFDGSAVDVLIPLKVEEDILNARGFHPFSVLGLLREGVGVDQANPSMRALAARMAEEYRSNEGWSADVVNLREDIFGNNRRILTLLMAAIGFVVLIGCANVANLLLVRGAARAHEFAVRTSLGCSGARLVRQLLTENLLLAAVGGTLGLAAAYLGLDVLLQMAPRDLPRIESVEMNSAVLSFTTVLCTLTAVAFGVGPAWQARRTSAADAMRQSGRTTPGSRGVRAERFLVTLEVALTSLLLVGAGLLLKSLWQLEGVDTGYRASGVLTFRLRPPESRYPNDAARVAYFEAVRERVAQLPGVDVVSSTWSAPLVSLAAPVGFRIPGALGDGLPAEEGSALWSSVMPDYFRAMGIPLLRGRDFTDLDTLDATHTAIVNRAFSERYFNGEDPIGRQLVSDGDSVEIVGVVENTLHTGVDIVPEEQYYVPMAGTPNLYTWDRTFVVRTELPPETLSLTISNAVLEVDRGLPASNVITLDQALRDETAAQRTTAALLAAFAVLALGLAAAGVYAVIGYFVGCRTPEFGIRAALGADSGRLFWFVLRRGASLAVPGLILGLLSALIAARSLESLLFAVEPGDIPTFATSLGTVVAACVAACIVPALRAASVSPMEALREE